MPVYKSDTPTKDGRSWYFRTYYTTPLGVRKQYESKLYMTKNEAVKEEARFINKPSNQALDEKKLLFKELKNTYYNYQKKKVRKGTYDIYEGYNSCLEFFDNYRVDKLTIINYEQWKEYMDNKGYSITYKNDILGFFKAILHFGTKYYRYDFTDLLELITDFTDPDALTKEMEYYTLEEYKRFIKDEDNLMWRTFFDTLYYMGYRKGEIRGLQWKDIDFKKRIIYLTKQIPSTCGKNEWHFAPLKTKASYRNLPINDIVFDGLKKLYEEQSKYENFTEDWFVFGDMRPLNCDDINYARNKRVKESKVKRIRIHDFRHSCASLLMANGASIILVMKYLGHSRMDETLQTYVHLFQSELDSIVGIIGKLQY